jgi:rhodanese-related sulfurtransferase
MVSDVIWYELGRRRGRLVLKMVCRISLEPDFCVRRTENAFARYGPGVLSFAKFVPGLNIAAPPLAAMFRMPFARFFAWDCVGAFVWSMAYGSIGYVFRKQLEQAGALTVHLGLASVGLLAGGLTLLAGWKYAHRRRFLQRLRMARITPEELLDKLQRGEDIIVADLRHPLDYEADRAKVPGALRLLPEELDERHEEIPRDREVVLYCNCPNEATSAGVALKLHRLGITRVRPLAGGFEAWRARGYPLEPADAAAPIA